MTKTQYLKLVYHLLPSHGKNERRFFCDFKNSVDDYIESQNSNSNIDLTSEFGEPQDVVSDFLRFQTSTYLLRQINRHNYYRIILILVTSAIFVMLSIFSITCYNAYQDSEDSVITHDQTTITTILEGEE